MLGLLDEGENVTANALTYPLWPVSVRSNGPLCGLRLEFMERNHTTPGWESNIDSTGSATIAAAAGAAEPWQYRLETDLTMTQSYYSDNWAGSEVGNINWIWNFSFR